MTVLHVVVLAVIQGVTEFLPISSSGHLILLPSLTGWQLQRLEIDVAVHVGTLGAVFVYFWRDISNMVVGTIGAMTGKNAAGSRLAFMIIIATTPLILIGGIVWVMEWTYALRSTAVIGWTTLGFGIVLYLVDRFFLTVRTLDRLKWNQALAIGIAQVLAIVPGTSRAGITKTATRLFGFERTDAARFATLMSIPAIALPGLLVSLELSRSGNVQFNQMAALAAVLAFLFGLLAISLMMTWVRRSSFAPFAGYRVLLGIAILVWTYRFETVAFLA